MSTYTLGRRRWITGLLAALTASTLVLTGCGSDDESAETEHTGSDDHEHIDPVANDPAIAARAVATSLLSYDPADRVSPCDVADNVALLMLTGELAAAAEAPESPECMDKRPEQWSDWGAANAQIKAIITDTDVVDESDSEATVITTVRQSLSYPDGGSSTWSTTTQEIHLVAEDDRWKATSIEEKK